jgi:hypothetical protein
VGRRVSRGAWALGPNSILQPLCQAIAATLTLKIVDFIELFSTLAAGD